MPLLICHGRMFEGGPSNPEGMVFHYVIGCLCLFLLGTLGHGLLGVLKEGRDLTVLLFPYLNWGVNPVSYSCGISFIGY